MCEPHVDEENEEKNINGTFKIKNSILDNFKKLVKRQEKIRTKAGADLVKNLLECEEETEFQYALERIIRGLGSSTVDSRCGFYSTLMPLLNFSNISVDDVFGFVDKALHKSKSNSKSENADICLGQILVCGAIIRSKLFMKSSVDDQTKVLKCLLKAGKLRSYMLYPSYQILLDLVDKLSEEEFETLVFPLIQTDLEKTLPEYDLDSLHLMLTLRNKYPNVIKKINIENSQLLTDANLKDIANILLNISSTKALQHPVYECFVRTLLKTEYTTEFIKHLDDGLERYNKSKHLVVLTFTTHILKNLDNSADVPNLLQQNLIKQTLTVFRLLKGNARNNELKQTTHKLFDAILDALKKEEVKEKTKIAVLKKLLFHPGTFIFEKITKSKLVQQITGALQKDGVKKLAKVYREVIMLQNEKFNENSDIFQNNDRLYAAHLLVKLIGHSAVRDENDWKCEQLTFLMQLGLTKQAKVGVELAALLKSTFYRSLDLKLSKLDDVSNILLKIFYNLDSLLSEDNLESALRSPIAPETYTTWCKAKLLITKIESKKTKKIKLVFQILFLHLGLQLFNDVKLAKDSLEELFSCYERVKKRKHSEDGNDPAWIEVVIEIFLSLLSHNSHLLRVVINCVFPHLCNYLNGTAIHQILSVLDPKNENNPLTNKDEISDDDMETCDEENDSGDDSGEESEDEEEDFSKDEDIDESNNDRLRRALHGALMQNMDGGESDIDIDRIDEEQGEMLNQALGNIFKQFKPNIGKSKKQNKNDEVLTHFRVRVLDLIEIYLDSNPSMLLALEIMLPLLQALEFSIRDDHQKPLQDRLKSCLKKLTNLKKFENVDEVTDKTLYDLLVSLLEKGTKSNVVIQFMGDEIAQCCTFTIRCSQNLINIEETPKKVKKHLKRDFANIMKDSLDTYLKRRDCCLPVVLFKKVFELNWTGNLVSIENLMTIIFDEDIKTFRKGQGLELMRLFYTSNRLLRTSDEEVKCEIINMTKRLLEKCQLFFSELVKNPNNTKEKVISFLFTLIATIKHCPIKFEDFDWKNLGHIIREYRSFLCIGQETKKAYNKLCSAVGLPNVVEMKKSLIKLGTNNDDDGSLSIASNTKTKKKHEKKRNKENLILKKQAKQERMKSLSEGLQGGFSNIEEVNGLELEDTITVNGNNSVEACESKKRKSRNSQDVNKSKKNKT